MFGIRWKIETLFAAMAALFLITIVVGYMVDLF